MAEPAMPEKSASRDGRRLGPSVRSLSRWQAYDVVPRHPTAFISITDVGSPIATLPDHPLVRSVLRLSFDDLAEVEDGFVMFDRRFARQILDFFEQHRNDVRALFVHCEMGISRSVAIAIGLGQIYGVPVSHANGSDIWPNRLVLRELLAEASSADPSEDRSDGTGS